ncbi:MAG: OmpA family protein [Peptococcaceae bacterium]|nr:OmpA family protein [Peptococcaceae bacterium]
MARKKAADNHENHERWLITYSDLITLLMVFFVVMYSMSKVDAYKFQAMAEALSISLGGSQMDIAQHPQGPSFIEEGGPESSASLEQTSIETLKAKLDAYAQDNAISTRFVADIEERGLVISIQETLLFESGSDILNAQARTILGQISEFLATMPNYIRVEGHTDNLPINSGRFPSNWELSVMRASNVIHILRTEGVSTLRLSAVGYSEYRPLTSNDTSEGRARNRRVDLVILRSTYNPAESGDTTINRG